MAKSVWEALKAAAGTPQQPTAGQVLRDLFGPGRGDGPDTAKAAQALGVSRRTVQRWMHDGLPNTPVAKRLQKRHRRWRNESQAGRRATLAAVQNRPLGSCRFVGRVIISSDRRNNDVRNFHFNLSPEDIAQLTDTAATSTQRDLHANFEHLIANKGFGGSVQLEIQQLDLR